MPALWVLTVMVYHTIAPKDGAPTGVCIYPCGSGLLAAMVYHTIAPKGGAPTMVPIRYRRCAPPRTASLPVSPRTGCRTASSPRSSRS